jgi:hypothetical protein
LLVFPNDGVLFYAQILCPGLSFSIILQGGVWLEDPKQHTSL